MTFSGGSAVGSNANNFPAWKNQKPVHPTEDTDYDNEIDNDVQDLENGTSFYKKFFGNADFLGRCLNKNTYAPLKRTGAGDIGAGHVGRYISLANPDKASAMACHVPAGIIGTMLGIWFLALLWSPQAFVSCFIMLCIYMFLWATFMGVTAWSGIMQMRAACKKNWDKAWEELQASEPGIDSGMLHFVVIPNYAEDEQLLSETILNIANNPIAKKYMVMVLAMEAREGQKGKDKAKCLIDRHQHLFMGMFATYHPTNIPTDVAGKSSNTQWAFREVQKWYGAYVSRNSDDEHDASKVFIHIVDADSIHHKDYFTHLTVTALQQTQEERSWTLYQPPILNFRNCETVPAALRTSAYGTFVFEISGLAMADYLDHLCFSTYSLSLGLANHPIVDGWDTDVIAEDHHMFFKCMSASYWEELFSDETNRSVKNTSKVKVVPIWCPVTSYLVEDERGTLWSIWARYKQARRHMQGVAELSYCLLQHIMIARESREPMPWRCHLQFMHLCLKYASMTIFNAVLSFGNIIMTLVGIFLFFYRAWTGELAEAMSDMNSMREDSPMFNALLGAVCLFMPVVANAIVFANWAALKDSYEGIYCPLYLQNLDPTNYEGRYYTDEKDIVLVKDHKGNSIPQKSHASDASPKKDNGSIERVAGTRTMTWWSQMKLLLRVYGELNIIGQPTSFIFSTVPCFAAAIGLSRFGHKFDYIVAEKPMARADVPTEKVGKPLDNFA